MALGSTPGEGVLARRLRLGVSEVSWGRGSRGWGRFSARWISRACRARCFSRISFRRRVTRASWALSISGNFKAGPWPKKYFGGEVLGDWDIGSRVVEDRAAEVVVRGFARLLAIGGAIRLPVIEEDAREMVVEVRGGRGVVRGPLLGRAARAGVVV